MKIRSLLGLTLTLGMLVLARASADTPHFHVPGEVAGAIARFNALHSVHADGSLNNGESIHIEYEAPDRFRVDLGKGIHGVVMGHVVWIKAYSKPWHRMPAGAADRIQLLVNFWRSVHLLGIPDQYQWHDGGTTAEGHKYTAERFGDGESTIWISGGEIVGLLRPLGEQVRFSHFNGSVDIEAPAASEN